MRQIGDAILDFSDYMLVFIMFQSSFIKYEDFLKISIYLNFWPYYSFSNLFSLGNKTRLPFCKISETYDWTHW